MTSLPILQWVLFQASKDYYSQFFVSLVVFMAVTIGLEQERES